VLPVATARAQAQAGFSRSAMSSALDSGYKGLDKTLAAVAARMRKHLGGASGGLLSDVWASLERSLLAQLRQLEADVVACYPDLDVPTPSSHVADMLRAAAPT
jgi:hypothetical protein